MLPPLFRFQELSGGARVWERRWVVLRRPILVTFRAKGDEAPVDVLHLHDCELRVRRAALEFELRNLAAGAAMRAQAANEADLDAWVGALRAHREGDGD